jgi:phage-related protein
MPDSTPENTLVQLKQSLQELSTLLDNPAVRTAIGAVPDALMKPVIDGLKTILNVLKDALSELKNSLGSVTQLGDLLKAVNDLLTAAEGLAPGQKSTLETVKTIVKTLQDIPGVADIDEILTLVGQIVGKLAAL